MHFSTTSALLALSSLLSIVSAGSPAGYGSPGGYTSSTPAGYGSPGGYTSSTPAGYGGKPTKTYAKTTAASTPTSTPVSKNACNFAKKKSAVKAEMDTIVSHSFSDAALIPLAADATRTFFITPNEAPEMTVEINVGTTAESVRDELVLLGTILNAGVPADSLKYIKNRNGTVTSDFIQTDDIVLPSVNVREIHTFNDDCQITSIVGYVQGDIVCPVGAVGLVNSALVSLCTQLEGLGLVGSLQKLDKSE